MNSSVLPCPGMTLTTHAAFWERCVCECPSRQQCMKPPGFSRTSVCPNHIFRFFKDISCLSDSYLTPMVKAGHRLWRWELISSDPKACRLRTEEKGGISELGPASHICELKRHGSPWHTVIIQLPPKMVLPSSGVHIFQAAKHLFHVIFIT